MKRLWLKFKTVFHNIWKDPVMSQLISLGIFALITWIWKELTNRTWRDVYVLVIKFLSFPVPIFVFLSAIALYFIVMLVIKNVKNRENSFWEEQIGNFKFKDLHNLLILQQVPQPIETFYTVNLFQKET